MRKIWWILVFSGCLYLSCKPNFICDPTASDSALRISINTYKCPLANSLSTTLADSAYNQDFYKIYAIRPKQKDSALYQDSLATDTLGYSSLVFPVSNISDSVQYVLVVNTSKGITPILVRDTLTIRYSPSLHYISAGCGYNYYYNLNNNNPYSFTGHYFDFITEVSGIINPTNPSNFNLFKIKAPKKRCLN